MISASTSVISGRFSGHIETQRRAHLGGTWWIRTLDNTLGQVIFESDYPPEIYFYLGWYIVFFLILFLNLYGMLKEME